MAIFNSDLNYQRVYGFNDTYFLGGMMQQQLGRLHWPGGQSHLLVVVWFFSMDFYRLLKGLLVSNINFG